MMDFLQVPPPAPSDLLVQWATVVGVLCGAVIAVSAVMSLIYREIVARRMRAIAIEENKRLETKIDALDDKIDGICKSLRDLTDKVHFHFDANGQEDLFAPEDRHQPTRFLVARSRDDLRDIRLRVREIEGVIPGVQRFISTHVERHHQIPHPDDERDD